MKVLVVTIILFFLKVFCYAYDIEKATPIMMRDGIAYEKFKTTPYTGIGKFYGLKDTDDCYIVLGKYKNGKADGAYERWSCDGKLLEKGNAVNNELNGLTERWNKQGRKIAHIFYRNNKPWSGWEKEIYVDIETIDIKAQYDILYKNGKKTGYQMFGNHKCYEKHLYEYYKDGKYLGCQAYKNSKKHTAHFQNW